MQVRDYYSLEILLLENAKVELTKPFEKADELRDKTLRLAEINKLLDMGEVEELENQSPLLEDLKRAIVDYSNYEFSESNSYEDFDKLYPHLSHSIIIKIFCKWIIEVSVIIYF